MKTIINSEKSLYDCIEKLRLDFAEHKYLRVDVKTGKQRTDIQNACLHLYCTQIAENLNNQGLTFNAFFKHGFEVKWTMQIVKDNIWRPVQLAVCGKESTTKPTTSEYQQIFDPINLKLAEFGLSIPWPSKESLQHGRGNS